MSILIRNSKALASGIIEKEGFDSVEPMPFGGATSLAYRVRIDGKEYFMKRLRPELKSDWRYRSAYQKEYEVGRSICNEHVVRYEAIDEDAEGLYILMEMVNGRTLEEKLATEPEYFARGRNFEKLFVQLLSGLQALHEAHVAYLDLKPENVMLTQVNSDVKIIDLGFCFADAYSHTVGTTQAFAAPELQRGDAREVDERTDIYALGQLMKYVRNVACVDIAPHMQRIIEKCTAPVMQDRYACVDEVIKAIVQKRRWIRSILIVLTIITTLSIGYAQYSKTDHYRISMQRLGWWLGRPDYDVRKHNYYRVLSEDSLIMTVVGGKRLDNLYIDETMRYEGKVYQVVSVADEAFGGHSFKSIYFPNGIREIGMNAFSQCYDLLSIHLPNSVEKIGVSCFENAKSLQYLQLSRNIKVIPQKAFTTSEKLEKLIIPEGGVEELGLDAFAICTSLKEVSLPSTLIKIDRGVFWRCRSLKEIRIPASVTEIGEFTFYDCDSLTDVYNYSPIPQVVPPIYNGRNITLHVPSGSEELYRKAENWNRAKVVAMED